MCAQATWLQGSGMAQGQLLGIRHSAAPLPQVCKLSPHSLAQRIVMHKRSPLLWRPCSPSDGSWQCTTHRTPHWSWVRPDCCQVQALSSFGGVAQALARFTGRQCPITGTVLTRRVCVYSGTQYNALTAEKSRHLKTGDIPLAWDTVPYPATCPAGTLSCSVPLCFALTHRRSPTHPLLPRQPLART
jgi:hypothetical protein